MTAQPMEGDSGQQSATPPSKRRTGLSFAWTAGIVGLVVLILLLIFILENLHSVRVSFLGANGRLPLGVALLLAAIAGAAILALLGVLRILQLRITLHRHRRALNNR